MAVHIQREKVRHWPRITAAYLAILGIAHALSQEREYFFDDALDDSFDVLDEAISTLDDLIDPAGATTKSAKSSQGNVAKPKYPQQVPGASGEHLVDLFRRALSPAKFYEFVLKDGAENFAKCDGTYSLNATIGSVNGKPIYVNKDKNRLLAASGKKGWTLTSLGYLEEIRSKQGSFGGYHTGGGAWPDGKDWQKYDVRREGKKHGFADDETTLEEHVLGHLYQLKDRAPVLDGLFTVLQNDPPHGKEEIAQLERSIWKVWQWHPDSGLMERMRQAISLMESEATYGIAMDILDVLVTEDPSYAEAYNKRAHLRFKMGEKVGGTELAMSDLAQAVELEPRHFGAKTNQAVGFLAAGRYTDAYVAFQSALKLHPQSHEIREGIASFKGRLEEAATGMEPEDSALSLADKASKIMSATKAAMDNAMRPSESGSTARREDL